MLNQIYRDSRYSFGYPACPSVGDQAQLLKLLSADEIGIHLREEDQRDLEQSTSAIVVMHPQAKYFRREMRVEDIVLFCRDNSILDVVTRQ